MINDKYFSCLNPITVSLGPITLKWCYLITNSLQLILNENTVEIIVNRERPTVNLDHVKRV